MALSTLTCPVPLLCLDLLSVGAANPPLSSATVGHPSLGAVEAHQSDSTTAHLLVNTINPYSPETVVYSSLNPHLFISTGAHTTPTVVNQIPCGTIGTYMSTPGAVYSNPPKIMHHLSAIHHTHGDAAAYQTTAHGDVAAYQMRILWCY